MFTQAQAVAYPLLYVYTTHVHVLIPFCVPSLLLCYYCFFSSSSSLILFSNNRRKTSNERMTTIGIGTQYTIIIMLVPFLRFECVCVSVLKTGENRGLLSIFNFNAETRSFRLHHQIDNYHSFLSDDSRNIIRMNDDRTIQRAECLNSRSHSHNRNISDTRKL